MMVPLKEYLHSVENALKAGNATEHTHRPALKALIESMDLQVIATNEPKRIACGAPDYIITRNGLTIGYIEAKDVGKSLAETERSANKSDWISGLLRGKLPDGGKTGNYYEVDGQPLGERNPKWLQDDYVKFIRFGQWRIERSGGGILAFITNHGYLDNPTFRGMRQSLMQTFTDIYILNLHGNAKKRETAPDGGKDENVFDIQQGVAIGIFVKQPDNNGSVKVYHADLWGTRAKKYEQLFEQDAAVTNWVQLNPQSPFYLFTPQNVDLLEEYNRGLKVTDIFPTNSAGIVTARDHFTIHWTKDEIWQTIQDFVQLPVEEARTKYNLRKDVRDWKVNLAQFDVTSSGPEKDRIVQILYRPFDSRYTYYTGQTRGFICMPRSEVMSHVLAGENLGPARAAVVP